MHLRRILLLNSGPSERCAFELPFHPNGKPKVVVLVGGNGSGKTNLLSIIADGLMELAQAGFLDVLPPLGGIGHSYYRISGGHCRRVGANFELAALHFRDIRNNDHYFRAQSGTVPDGLINDDVAPFGPLAANTAKDKNTHTTKEAVREAFRASVTAFFPSSRSELPHWLNARTLTSDPDYQLQSTFNDYLDKPLLIERGIQHLKPWIVDLILDQAVDAQHALQLFRQPPDQTQPDYLTIRLKFYDSLNSLNTLLRIILGRDDVRIVRTHRTDADRRIRIELGATDALPTLDSLSAGQATLLSIFGNVLRLGTSGELIPNFANCSGIVLVDEIDAHLHADLQFTALPALIQHFPNVQFIVSAHSPLFVLGMQKLFGNDGFELREMPTAKPISTERYSEFLRSFEIYKDTQEFERLLAEIGKGGRPIIVGEGKTDPMYFATAAELLGYDDVAASADFTSIGELDPGDKKTSGKDRLKKAVDIYRVTPHLLNRAVLAVYDQNVKAELFTAGCLGAIQLPKVDNHCFIDDGPENLIPSELITDEFLDRTGPKVANGKLVEITTIRKAALAEHLCRKLRNPAHFEGFRPLLDQMRAFLIVQGRIQAAAQP